MAGCTLWLFEPRLHAGVFRFAGDYEPALQPLRQRILPDSDRPRGRSWDAGYDLGAEPINSDRLRLIVAHLRSGLVIDVEKLVRHDRGSPTFWHIAQMFFQRLDPTTDLFQSILSGAERSHNDPRRVDLRKAGHTCDLIRINLKARQQTINWMDSKGASSGRAPKLSSRNAPGRRSIWLSSKLGEVDLPQPCRD
jgi:hypothetical protein